MQFEVSGQRYELDMSPEKLMGDEALLIEEKLGPGTKEVVRRWVGGEFGVRDVLVLTYLAAKRGGETRPFDEFIKTVAPATFRPIVDGKPVQRAKAKAGPPEGALGPMVRGRKTNPKAKAEEKQIDLADAAAGADAGGM